MKSDIEIADEVKLKPIADIAAEAGLLPADLELYGAYKAKVSQGALNRILSGKRKGKLILVSAMTPTPAGEGKTTTTIGLGQGIARLGKKVMIALREPSLGPTMGIKGGATGGGYSQVIPMEDINLHFTGDIHAVSTAHNLIAAALDNHIYQGNKMGIDPRRIIWRRVIDMNDRSLRNIVIGLGGKTQGVPRETGFDISAASEIMAALCLAENIQDLKERIGSMIVGFTYADEPVNVSDIQIAGAATALLKDAIKPNLVQTIEGVPALIHGGPFANIAQGTNSVIATKLALSLSDYAVTEAGFGFDLGAEKFFDIKCVSGGLSPSLVVLVVTIRALKMHGGVPLPDITKPNPAAVEKGLDNLKKHVENIKKFNMPQVIAVNKFSGDTQEEIAVVHNLCKDLCMPIVINDGWARGGAGAEALAQEVIKIADSSTAEFKPIYDWAEPIEDKIFKVASEIYGAKYIDYTKQAKKDLKKIYELGYDKLPVCIAKTQKSLSDNPELLGRPKDFVVTVREILINAGAKFLVPMTGNILRMPGLPKKPSAEEIDISADSKIAGLF